MFIDTHFHTFDNINMEEYLREAREAGGKYFLLCGGNLTDSHEALTLATQHETLYFAAGVHPLEAEKMEGELSDYEKIARHEKCVAIGEIGLDYYYEKESARKQQKILADFLALALEVGKPAILHCRDVEGCEEAYKNMYDLVKPFAEKGGRFVLHCYAGNLEYAQKFLALGGKFGVGGIVTFRKGENIREFVRAMPLESLFLETDAPYLAPIPFRGKTNHSRYIPYIAEKIAECKGITQEECGIVTSKNAEDFFSFPS